MKASIQDDVTRKVSKEAKELFVDAGTDFIHFITGEALLKAQQARSSTLKEEHILDALYELGFEFLHDYCQLYLEKYNEVSFHVPNIQAWRK